MAAQLVDRDAYLKLAENLEGFLARLRDNAATVAEQQRVLRLLVKDVLIGPERIVIRHCIPTGGRNISPTTKITDGDADEEPPQVRHCVGGVFTRPCGVTVHICEPADPAS